MVVPPTWVDSFLRDDVGLTADQAAETQGAPPSKPQEIAAEPVAAQPSPAVASSPPAPTEPAPEVWEDDASFIRKQTSRCLLGPPTEVQKTHNEADQEMRRVTSLSCFRDVALPGSAVEDEAHVPMYVGKNPDIPVVIITSEVNPFSKTGGLALVCGSYAEEFPKRGHRTMVISPMYDYYPNCEFIGRTNIWLMGGETQVQFFYFRQDVADGKHCDFVFVDHPCFHRPGGLYYNAQEGVEYEDNLFRFALFSIASLEAIKHVPVCGSPYGDRVTLLANDWQCALVPVYLVHRYRPGGSFNQARCLFVVHNFGYQGIYPLNKLVPSDQGPLPVIVKNVGIEDLGLSSHAYEHLIYVYEPHLRSYEGDDGHVLNLTKGGLLTADRILTVSPGYAQEMKTPEGGFRLEELVKHREFFLAGILNGIDTALWNPQTDVQLAVNYGVADFETGRASNKQQLQERLNLRVDPDIPIVSFVGRLTSQKGVDIILECIDWMCTNTGNGVTGQIQVILMGHGDAHYADTMRAAENRWKGTVCAYVGFDPKIEHIIYGGSDFLMMPSRYEPCGLPQMYALRYGCIPVVTACGGLKDSVVAEPPEEATGFYILPLTDGEFKKTLYAALETYLKDRPKFREMQLRGMKQDFSWCRAMDTYEQNIDWTHGDPPYIR